MVQMASPFSKEKIGMINALIIKSRRIQKCVILTKKNVQTQKLTKKLTNIICQKQNKLKKMTNFKKIKLK